MLPVFFKKFPMYKTFFLLLLLISILSSCLVQSPKYTSIDQVMSLEPGMTKVQVEERLGVKPYDVRLLLNNGVDAQGMKGGFPQIFKGSCLACSDVIQS